MKTTPLSALLKETKKLEVLYIEDDEQTRHYTLIMLNNFFPNITTAIDGQDGLSKFKARHFDLVVTDINMPNMDGIALIKNIRLLDNMIPVIIFSAHDEVEYFLNSIKLGIDGYILKPYDFVEVEEVITNILHKLSDIKKNSNLLNLTNDFYWDTANETLYKEKERIALTKSELLLFRLLTSRARSIYSAADIEIYVFDDMVSDIGRVRNLLSRLKSKLQCTLIESIYGEGYRLKL